MKRFDAETRARLATGWDSRVCTLREYARANDVSERAIRLWRAQLRDEPRVVEPERHEEVPLHAALDALQARLNALEAEVRAVHAALDERPPTVQDEEACRLVPAGTEDGVQPEAEAMEDAQGATVSGSATGTHDTSIDSSKPEPPPVGPSRNSPLEAPRPAKRGVFLLDFQ